MKEVPLFILNGFLDSGKTTIIKTIIDIYKSKGKNVQTQS